MRYDWTPLWRSTIGFDRLFDVLDEVQRTAEESYPPYNIERLDENRFQISVALAGFTPDEVSLTAEQNVLTLEGRKAENDEKVYLHRGISARADTSFASSAAFTALGAMPVATNWFASTFAASLGSAPAATTSAHSRSSPPVTSTSAS